MLWIMTMGRRLNGVYAAFMLVAFMMGIAGALQAPVGDEVEEEVVEELVGGLRHRCLLDDPCDGVGVGRVGDGVGVDGQRVGECFWLFVRAAGVQSDHYAAERNGQQE